MAVFDVEVRPEFSRFPWWNHWPVAQVASDGRHALAPDRAAHSSLSWGGPRGNSALYGLTDQPAASLVALARSWIDPPRLSVAPDTFVSEGYRRDQRAYVVRCSGEPGPLTLQLAGSDGSPVVNPAFVVRGWGEGAGRVRVDGEEVARGEKLRLVHRYGLKETDLIIWLKIHRASTVMIEVLPENTDP